MNIQTKAKDFFGGACYAFCLSYMFGSPTDYKDMLMDVVSGYVNSYIDDYGFVLKPVEFVNSLLGKKIYKDVQHIPFEPSLDEKQIVMWKYNDNTHFVVMQGNKIIFDPYGGESETIKKGKPFTFRKFIGDYSNVK